MDSSSIETLRDFARATGVAINSIKINSGTLEIRDGRPIWLKRRKPGSELIAISANMFFRLTGARIRVRVNPEKWQRWEVSCFRLLHGGGFRAFATTVGLPAETFEGGELFAVNALLTQNTFSTRPAPGVPCR